MTSPTSRRSLLRTALATAAAPLLAWVPGVKARAASKAVADGSPNFEVPRLPGQVQVAVFIGPHVATVARFPFDKLKLGKESDIPDHLPRRLRGFLLMNPDPSKWNDLETLNVPPADVNHPSNDAYMEEMGRRMRAYREAQAVEPREAP